MHDQKLRASLKRRRHRGTSESHIRNFARAATIAHSALRIKRKEKRLQIIYDQPHRCTRSPDNNFVNRVLWGARRVSEYWLKSPPHPAITSPTNFSDVDIRTIYALQPELAGIPLNDLRVALHKSTVEFKYVVFPRTGCLIFIMRYIFRCWDSVVQVRTKQPRKALPKELEVVMDGYGLSTTPTHYIALYGTLALRPKWSQHDHRKISIIPVHAFVLAMYCSKIDNYPPSKRTIRPAGSCRMPCEGGTRKPGVEVQRYALRLPVLPIVIPDPSSFTFLLQYFYTGSLKAFCLNVAPYLASEPAGWPVGQGHDTSEGYATTLSDNLARNHPPPALRNFLENLWWLSWNMVALGVSEPTLWAVLSVQTSCLQRAVALQRDEGVLPFPTRQESPSTPDSHAAQICNTQHLTHGGQYMRHTKFGLRGAIVNLCV